MPVYAYRGRHVRTNESITGERFSNSAQALAGALRREQVAPISITEKKSEGIKLSFGKKKVKQNELAIFTRQFSIMLNAGLPLIQCLAAIGQQNTNSTFRETLEQVRTDVEAGSTLADAMSKHPKVFDQLYTNMIGAGEVGGMLDTILQRLAVFIEKIVKLKSALRSAFIYPAVVMTIAIGVVGIVLWKVVPVFKTLFEGFNTELPLMTRVVIALSAFLQTFGVFVVAFFVVCAFGLRNFYRTDKGRYLIDGLILKSPILGDIFRKICVARFTRTLATLLSSGVPILEGLDVTGKTAGNAILEENVRKLRKHIEEGKTMAEPMRESGFFPPMVTQMVSVGESTGELDTMLIKIADYYEEEVDVVVANMLTILEPVLMVFLGVVVGGIVISLYMPMFKLIQVLSGG